MVATGHDIRLMAINPAHARTTESISIAAGESIGMMGPGARGGSIATVYICEAKQPCESVTVIVKV